MKDRKETIDNPSTSKTRRYVILGGIVVVCLIAIWIVLTYIPGSGFGPTLAIAETTQEVNGTLTRTISTQYVSGKTFWDLLQLLIVPAVLIWGAYWLNQRAQKRETAIAQARRQNEAQIAEERLEETTLETYLDQMTDLIVNRDLLTQAKDSPIRLIARVRTSTVVRRLNGKRCGIVLKFLVQAGLFERNDAFQLMNDVDLSGADLHAAKLLDVSLNGKVLDDSDFTAAELVGTSLVGASLKRANLRVTWLDKADFTEADLTGANLSNATIRNAKFHQAILTGANFFAARLDGSDLSEASLRNANLDTASLTGVNLYSADLTTASLTWANLQNANLRNATVTNDQLKSALALKGAIMPKDGLYDGRFSLVLDTSRAQQDGVDIGNPEAVRQWHLKAQGPINTAENSG